MNKFYIIFVILTITSLLFANIPAPSNAASNLDYMLTIAENAKKYCKSEIEARETVEPKIKELYLQSISEIDKLEDAIDANDVKAAREHFVSAMQKMREISLMINELEIVEAKSSPSISKNPVLERFEMNIQKLKTISVKLGANVDFQEIDELMTLAKQTNAAGNTKQTKQIIDDINEKGNSIYQTLKSINEQNKIVRAKALAEKHIQQINILILQAKELGLEDSVTKLEKSKLSLISANNTAQIKQNIRVIIVLHNTIEKSKLDVMEEVKRSEIKFSQQEKLSLQISQLENKIKILSSNAYGNNAAMYYLEKATTLIESAKLDLETSLDSIPNKIKQIEKFLLKVERLLQNVT